jgi:hypothetical protein
MVSPRLNGKVMRPEFHSRQARAVDADALADNGVFQVLIVRNGDGETTRLTLVLHVLNRAEALDQTSKHINRVS